MRTDATPEGQGSELESLMRRYQEADPQAPCELIARLSPALYRFFASQMGSREEADDLLQETWMRLHRVRHTYRPGEPVLPWVYAIARHVRVDAYRKRRRISGHELQVETLPDRPPAPAPAQVLPELASLLAQLPASQRDVVTMLKVGGLSLEEVARATASTVGSVKQKAHRAYEKLRRLIEEARSPERGDA